MSFLSPLVPECDPSSVSFVRKVTISLQNEFDCRSHEVKPKLSWTIKLKVTLFQYCLVEDNGFIQVPTYHTLEV